MSSAQILYEVTTIFKSLAYRFPTVKVVATIFWLCGASMNCKRNVLFDDTVYFHLVLLFLMTCVPYKLTHRRAAVQRFKFKTNRKETIESLRNCLKVQVNRELFVPFQCKILQLTDIPSQCGFVWHSQKALCLQSNELKMSIPIASCIPVRCHVVIVFFHLKNHQIWYSINCKCRLKMLFQQWKCFITQCMRG